MEWLNDVGCTAFIANMIRNCQMFLAKLRVRLLNIEKNTHIVTEDARCMGNRHSKGMERVVNGQDLFNGCMHSNKYGTVSQSLNRSLSLANPNNWSATNKTNDTQDSWMPHNLLE